MVLRGVEIPVPSGIVTRPEHPHGIVYLAALKVDVHAVDQRRLRTVVVLVVGKVTVVIRITVEGSVDLEQHSELAHSIVLALSVQQKIHVFGRSGYGVQIASAFGATVVVMEPLPMEKTEYGGLNALRELTPLDTLRGMLRPGADPGCTPAEFLARADRRREEPDSDTSTIHQVDGRGWWYLGPGERDGAYDALPTPRVRLESGGSHAVLPFDESTKEALLRIAGAV